MCSHIQIWNEIHCYVQKNIFISIYIILILKVNIRLVNLATIHYELTLIELLNYIVFSSMVQGEKHYNAHEHQATSNKVRKVCLLSIQLQSLMWDHFERLRNIHMHAQSCIMNNIYVWLCVCVCLYIFFKISSTVFF